MSAAKTEAEASGLNMQTHLNEPVTPNDHLLGNYVEIPTDPEPIKSWAEIIDETEGTTNQSAEIKTLKRDFPGNEAKPNQQKRKTRRETLRRHRGRRIGEKHATGKQDICRSITKHLLKSAPQKDCRKNRECPKARTTEIGQKTHHRPMDKQKDRGNNSAGHRIDDYGWRGAAQCRQRESRFQRSDAPQTVETGK
ncbi:hypothetical protein SRHO_G00285610 [Serrasalmus rhombeus]